ncbi:MAG: M48 family metalloprotease [Anaerolineales bacterium]|nr:M48 family metalloprotease [Anaerolineales bacterium]
MLIKLFNHFRLTWRVANDKRVNLWLKLFLGGAPLVYAALPTPDDFLPVVGLLDEFVFLGLCTLIFTAASPMAVVNEHKRVIDGGGGNPGADLDLYRYPSEQRDLASGFVITFLLLILGGWYAGILGAILFGFGYLSAAIMRSRALSNAVQVTENQLAHLHGPLRAAQRHLPHKTVELFVTQNPVLNAYTFGYGEPYTIILTSALVERLTPEEIQAVIGHELGHVHLGHASLISLMSGLGGIARLLFYRWSRSCEYSADAIALLASDGDPKPVVSSLLKLSSGLTDVSVDVDSFLRQADGENGAAASVAELTSTHPFMNNRIKNLVQQTSRLEVNEAYA